MGFFLPGSIAWRMGRIDTALATFEQCKQTFSEVGYDETLIEPVCQASIRRHSWPKDGAAGKILFSNPADTKARKKLTVRLSEDDCLSWSASKVLWPGPAAYSCLAVLEDGYGNVARVNAVKPEAWFESERSLLEEARLMMPRIPFDSIDILVVDEIGKEISGAGMDPNVIGRHIVPFAKFPPKPKILRIFVRDLTPNTYGNATGIGLADFTSQRLVDKVDYHATYMNCITGGSPEQGRIPPHYKSDRETIETASRTFGLVKPKERRRVWQ